MRRQHILDGLTHTATLRVVLRDGNIIDFPYGREHAADSIPLTLDDSIKGRNAGDRAGSLHMPMEFEGLASAHAWIQADAVAAVFVWIPERKPAPKRRRWPWGRS
jgi:hypothetical protein